MMTNAELNNQVNILDANVDALDAEQDALENFMRTI